MYLILKKPWNIVCFSTHEENLTRFIHEKKDVKIYLYSSGYEKKLCHSFHNMILSHATLFPEDTLLGNILSTFVAKFWLGNEYRNGKYNIGMHLISLSIEKKLNRWESFLASLLRIYEALKVLFWEVSLSVICCFSY